MQGYRLVDAQEALRFILAGNSFFTVKSRTGNRYTFQVMAPKDELPAENPLPGMEDIREIRRNYDSETRFVKVLTGPDNEDNYSYIGILNTRTNLFRLTKKSRMTSDSLPVKAISWLVAKLAAGLMPTTCELWHEGFCGRCGRKLTVPESIQSGYGPECIQIMRRKI